MDAEGPTLRAGTTRSVPRKRSGAALNAKLHRQTGKTEAPARDWRRVHHSPWFWVGVAMFMLAILTYVFSEDLSLRPRLHRSAEQFQGRPLVVP